MPTCPPNLRHSFLTVCEIIRFKAKEIYFPIVPERYSIASGAKITILGHRYGFPEFKFLFLGELGTCVQNLIFTKVVEGCQKNYFSQRGYAEIQIQRPVFVNKNSIWKILGLIKIRKVEIQKGMSTTNLRNFHLIILTNIIKL